MELKAEKSKKVFRVSRRDNREQTKEWFSEQRNTDSGGEIKLRKTEVGEVDAAQPFKEKLRREAELFITENAVNKKQENQQFDNQKANAVKE